MAAGEIVLLDYPATGQKLSELYAKSRQVSILVYGDVSKTSAENLLLFQGAQLVLEDLGSGRGAKALMDVASDVVPHTSFGYLSTEFFTGSSGRKAA